MVDFVLNIRWMVNFAVLPSSPPSVDGYLLLAGSLREKAHLELVPEARDGDERG